MKRDSERLDWPSCTEQPPFSCPSQWIPVSSEISSAAAAVEQPWQLLTWTLFTRPLKGVSEDV